MKVTASPESHAASDHSPQSSPLPPSHESHWPQWHATADYVALFLLVIVAFFAASFAARNSDVWLHLASGRQISTLDYPWGHDPFSFTNANRPWVNSSWLFDLGLYAVYQLDATGGVAVVLKALSVVIAIGLMLRLKSSGHSFWPLIILTTAAVLAAAPSLTLEPHIASMLFLAVTVLLIFSGNWSEGNKWRMPIRIGVLFVIWANVDAWHLLGPFTLLLMMFGEYVHKQLWPASAPSVETAPFPSTPPLSGLTRALIVGMIACTLNPTFLVAVFQNPGDALGQRIPAELPWGYPTDLFDDPELATLLVSPFSSRFAEDVTLGNNLNGLAFVLLIITTVAAFACDFPRIKLSHLFVWLGYLILALLNVRLIPFFALVSIPLAAMHWNSVSARIVLRGADDSRTRILLAMSGVARIVTVPLLAVMAIAAWPGWLHPPSDDPAVSRRVEWAITADPGPARVCLVQNRWSADPDSRDILSLTSSIELGDYLAWLAPGRKTFIDSRIGFHRNVLPDLLRLRRELGLVRRPNDPEPDPTVVRELVLSYDAKAVVILSNSRGRGLDRDEQRDRFLAAFAASLFTSNEWRLWHLDGRSAILGRADTQGAEKLRFDPVRLAYGPEVTPIAKGSVTPARPAVASSDWQSILKQIVAPLIERPSPLPPEVDDATVYDQYGRARLDRLARSFQINSTQRLYARASVAGIGPVFMVGTEPPPTDDIQHAYPLLALRAARQAVAKCPDRAEPYRVLAWAYDSPGLALFQPMSLPVIGPRFTSPDRPPVGIPLTTPGDRPDQLMTALVRAMARLPQPGDSRPDQALLGLTWSLQLAELYYRPPSRQLPQDQLDNYLRSQQLDLAREALQSANAYAQVAMQRPELIRRIIPTATQDSDPIPAFLKDIADRESKLTELILPRNDLVDQQSGPDKPVQRFVLAAVMGLPGKAIEAFKEVKNPADFGGPDQYLAAAVQMIELEFRAGRLEDASGDVDALAEVIGSGGKSSLGPTANDILRYLKFRVAHLGGNYEAAGEAWMELFEGRLPQLPADLRSAAVGVQTADVAAAGLIGGGVGSAVYFEWAAARMEQASRLLNLETGFHYNLGILALQEGNIPLATEHLERALKPQGIDLVELGDTVAARQIDTYLQLIRKTHNK